MDTARDRERVASARRELRAGLASLCGQKAACSLCAEGTACCLGLLQETVASPGAPRVRALEPVITTAPSPSSPGPESAQLRPDRGELPGCPGRISLGSRAQPPAPWPGVFSDSNLKRRDLTVIEAWRVAGSHDDASSGCAWKPQAEPSCLYERVSCVCLGVCVSVCLCVCVPVCMCVYVCS